MSLDKYLQPPKDIPHPIIRRWQKKKSQSGGRKLRCKFVRERNGLTFQPAEVHVFVEDMNGKNAAIPDSELWDAQLDEWLIENQVQAVTKDNEAERFGYGLEERFSQAESRFGDGYFNAVLRVQLHNSELGRLAPVEQKLQLIRENRPLESEAFVECEEMIEQAIASVGRDLTQRLKYGRDDAIDILGNALAYYLDERFNVTNRRMLGWL